jgi:UDP:flavonoid glycosyltransferase YjiC (YdhE family)
MRVALVAGPDPGHAFNAIGVGATLARRGHDVTVATGTPHRTAVEGEGCRFVELPLLAPTSGDHDLGHRLWRRAGEMAPPLAERLRPLRPDVVVADVLTRAGAFAAELLGVPWVELSPHHLYDPDPWVPPVGLGRRPARGRWRRRSDDRIRRAEAESRAAGAVLERETRALLGLPAGGGAPALRLLCTLPALELPRRHWPADTHLVGPVGWEPPWPPLVPPDGPAPLVVVTDSTASTVGRSLAATALAGLRHAGVRLVVTSGRDDLTPWPVGCAVGRTPHGPLLDRAAVAVGPGGGGFVGKALVRGVPLVVVPLLGDQREAAGRVRHAGLGVGLRPGLCTPATLRLAVERVLTDPDYRRRAEAVAADARRRGLGAGLAADLVAGVRR